MRNDWRTVLLILAAIVFAAAVVLPEVPFGPYRLRIVAAGLLLWVLEAALVSAGAL